MRHYHLVLVLLVLAVVAVMLNACATRPPIIRVQCLHLKSYKPAEEQAMAAELATADPALSGMARDYLQMRDADRACLATKASP